jgi:hypothetical protein
MEENTKNKQLINLDEDQLQAITGGTGGRPSKFFNVPETPGVQTLLDQHQREAQQALSDAENFRIAGDKKKADKAFGEAKMHYDMMTHIYNNRTKS